MAHDSTVSIETTGVPVRTLRIEVTDGPDRGRVHTSSSDLVTVGSAPTATLSLRDDTVSRYHLDLERRPDGIWIVDHGSTNGTMFGGIRLAQATVPVGTSLRLGNTSVRIDDGEMLTVESYDGAQLGRLVGQTASMKRLMARVERASKSTSSVLVLGETGTGKEVVARAVHSLSPRSDAAFETVDCGSMMPTLIGSELFGHERGAFTGADEQHIGAFERADGGTIFLDEIGELPPALQTALLGALERRKFRRLGGRSEIPVDVRVVCATNRDLRAEVNTSTFRQDLYYRIAVVTIALPPLRERPEDIPLLAAHFAREAGYDAPIANLLPGRILEDFKAHRWPGNVRELRNVVEAALVMGEAPDLARSAEPAMMSSDGGDVAFGPLLDRPYADARADMLATFEAHYLERLLDKTDGNVSEAAREAKMHRSHLNRLLRRHQDALDRSKAKAGS